MVALAQKIIEANDKSKGEVAVNVEMIEVNSNKMRTLGIDPDKSLTVGPNINFKTSPVSPASGQWGRQYSEACPSAPAYFLVSSFCQTPTARSSRAQLR